MLRYTKAMVKLNSMTPESAEASQLTIIGQDQWLQGFSTTDAASAHHQEEQKKRRADFIHTNVHEFRLHSWGLVDPILVSVNSNHTKFIQCYSQFPTINASEQCKSGRKAHAILPDTTTDPTSASKYISKMYFSHW